MPAVKLGRKAIKNVPARRLLAHSLLEMLPHPPLFDDNTNGITDWGMMLNDELGDCTCAGLAHSLQVATDQTGTIETASDAIVRAAYEQFCGYNPTKPETDQGGVEVDVLTDTHNLGFNGHQLIGWASIDPSNIDHVKKAIAYFGSIYIGAAMPLSAQINGPTTTWDVVDGKNGVAGGWGGHCMVSARYNQLGVEFISWGANQPATWSWFRTYVDEVHVLLWDCWQKMFPVSTMDTVLGMMRSLDTK